MAENEPGLEGRRDASAPGDQLEPPRVLSEAAKRALQEAEVRRAARLAAEAKAKAEAELGGRSGPDPVRYGDWENGGIASDF